MFIVHISMGGRAQRLTGSRLDYETLTFYNYLFGKQDEKTSGKLCIRRLIARCLAHRLGVYMKN